MNNRQIIIAGLVFSMLYVVIGAFGAHALKDIIGDSIDTFNTGSEYHAFHGLSLVVMGALGKHLNIDMSKAAYSIIAGIVLFSGSLYLMSTLKINLGIITPIGGLGFIVGWWVAIRKILKS